MIRWNALAMVLRANAESSELGGHIASFQSAATLYDVGFMHFFRGASESHGGDLLFIQGHSSPGIYARSFVEGRLTEEQLTRFRQEVDGGGLSSYPHPWLMPDYWQMPTVSMGLGPIMAIYQARFLKYLARRGLADTADRTVWAFLGDGETEEPESLGAIAMASREKLDNLIFVINCNLQRLDGPVRGNGKIIQELEGLFRGAASHRPADSHPGQDDQWLRDGGIGRGPEHPPSAEAHGVRGPGQVPRPVRPAADRRAAGRAAVPALRRGQRGNGLPALTAD